MVISGGSDFPTNLRENPWVDPDGANTVKQVGKGEVVVVKNPFLVNGGPTSFARSSDLWFGFELNGQPAYVAFSPETFGRLEFFLSNGQRITNWRELSPGKNIKVAVVEWRGDGFEANGRVIGTAVKTTADRVEETVASLCGNSR